MKNTIKLFTLLLALSFSATSFAQGAYVRLGAGFHTGAFKTNEGSIIDNTNGTNETTNYSLGGGTPITLGLGMDFTENLGIDLGVDYWLGSKTETAKLTTAVAEDVTEAYTRQIRVTPSLVISTGFDDPLAIYLKGGVVIPVSGKTTDELSRTGSGTPDIFRKGESQGQIGLGYSGAAGVMIGLSEKLSLYGEFNVVSLSISGDSREVVEFTSGGTDGLAGLPTGSKEFTYVDELSGTSNNPSTNPLGYDNTKATELARTSSAFGSWGINVGIKFNF